MCVNDDLYAEILAVLQKHKITKTRNRPNASGLDYVTQYGKNKGTNIFSRVGVMCESQNFGIVKKRFCHNGNIHMKYDQPFQPSANNHKYPLVYEALKKIIKAIDPDFEYNSITLNHNFKTLPHYDKSNKSPSLIVALGDYTGGELVIEDCKFDICCKPLIMNGGVSKHWTNDFVGERYSIVYYKI